MPANEQDDIGQRPGGNLDAPIPVTIVGGYLGAGKTTLVNHVLRHADGMRIAVLVNELGDLAIDADLIVARDGDMVAVAGGCVCCSYGSDLMAALMDLAQRQPRFDHVVLEVSGVALPRPVAASVSLLPAYTNDGIVVLVDATAVRRLAADRYLADTIDLQLAAADIVILNKIDLVDGASRDQLLAWLQEKAPGARAIPTVNAALPVDVITAARLGRTRPASGFTLPRHMADIYHTEVIEFPGVVDPHALGQALAAPELGLLRAKGIVAGPGETTWTIQVVASRCDVIQRPMLPRGVGRIVCIGLKHQIDMARLLELPARWLQA
ncbi:MAG: CobW family GTP-binding protein [Hyphomicrobiaceae bacterium]